MAKNKKDFGSILEASGVFDDVSLEKAAEKSDIDSVVEILTEKLNEFHTGELGHTFDVEYDDDMIELEGQILRDGILENIIVRPEKTMPGEYEVIVGHRRRYLAIKHRIPTMMCLVKTNLSDEDAIKLMVVSNATKRKHIKPSVLARSYKAYVDANKSSWGGSRSKGQLDLLKNTRAEAAEEFGISDAQIKRYLRLNDLVPDLLDLVDEGRLPLNTAYELSFLSDDDQNAVFDEIVVEGINISLDQAKELHQLAKTYKQKKVDSISRNTIHTYLSPMKKKAAFKITEKNITQLLPASKQSLSPEEKYDFIKKAVSEYLRKIGK